VPYSRRRSSVARRSNRRKLVWATYNVLNNTVPNANSDWANFDALTQLRVAGSSVLGATVMRTHLRLTVIGGTVAAGNMLTLGIGIGRLDDVGHAVGIDPITQAYADWMYYNAYSCPANGTFSGFNEYGQNTIIVDNKSKRKMEEMNQTLIFSVATNSYPADMSYDLFARILIALP